MCSSDLETLGAKIGNKFTGSFGIGCFSFFPTKNITTTEGGMLTTNNKNIYNYVKKLIAHYGIREKEKNIKIQIKWTNGKTEKFSIKDLNKTITIKQK